MSYYSLYCVYKSMQFYYIQCKYKMYSVVWNVIWEVICDRLTCKECSTGNMYSTLRDVFCKSISLPKVSFINCKPYHRQNSMYSHLYIYVLSQIPESRIHQQFSNVYRIVITKNGGYEANFTVGPNFGL